MNYLFLCAAALIGSPPASGGSLFQPGGASDFFGGAVVGMGDIDNDGVDDLAVSDPLHKPGELAKSSRRFGGAGKVWVVSGRDNSVLASVEGLARGDVFGAELLAPGDLDGDGVPDLIINAPRFDPTDWKGSNERPSGEAERPGYVLAYSIGKNETIFKIETTYGFYHTMWHGAHPAPSIALVGDFNGDEIPELAIGLPHADSDKLEHAGAVRLHNGKTGQLIGALYGTQSHEHLGVRVAPIDDLDGDHLGEILTLGGRSRCDSAVAEFETSSYAMAISSRSMKPVLTIAQDPEARFGRSICGMDDTNRDGYPDIAISTWNDQDFPVSRYSGFDGSLLGKWPRRTGNYPIDIFPVGDLDQDGVCDLGFSAFDRIITPKPRLAVVASGRGDSIIREFLHPDGPLTNASDETSPLNPSVSYSVSKWNASRVATELLIGTPTFRGDESCNGVVFRIDVATSKVLSTLRKSDLE